MKSFEQFVEEIERDGGMSPSAMGRSIRQPKNMKINRPRQPDYAGGDSYEILEKLKKPEVQMAVGKILQDEPETAAMLKDILQRALQNASMDHYNRPKFPGWSGNYNDAENAASNFVGDDNGRT